MLSAIFSWSALWWIMLIIYIPACLGLIAMVLLQKGKGSGFAGAFGVGPGSETVFGPRMSQSLPVRLTRALAAVFMILALAMTLVYGRSVRGAAPETVDVITEDQVIEKQFAPLLQQGVTSAGPPAPEEVSAPAAMTDETEASDVAEEPAPAEEASPAEETEPAPEAEEAATDEAPAEEPEETAEETPAPEAN